MVDESKHHEAAYLRLRHEDTNYEVSVEPSSSKGLMRIDVIGCNTAGEVVTDLHGEVNIKHWELIGQLLSLLASATKSGANTENVATRREQRSIGSSTDRRGSWTEEEIGHLRNLHESGMTSAQLAKHLDRTEKSIKWKLHSLGLAAFPSEEVSPPKLAKRHEPAYRVEDLRRTHSNSHKRWTEEEDVRISERFKDGANTDELMSEFGRNRNAIIARLNRLGFQVEK